MDYSVLMDQPVFVMFRDGMRFGIVKSIEYDCMTLVNAAYFVGKGRIGNQFCPEYFATNIDTAESIDIISTGSTLNITGVKEIAVITDNIAISYYENLFRKSVQV